ncbi:MAG: hypothetical protein AAFQ58_19185 [Pseudomonadota bacterium]
MAEQNHGLTPKEEQFAQNLFNGMSKIDAYADAYDPDPERERDRLSSDAWKVMQRPKVAQRLSELQDIARRTFIYGAKEAVADLESDRKFARKHKAASAAVTATKAKMRLFGLDTATVSLTDGQGNPLIEQLSEEQRLEKLKTQIPALEVLLPRIGYKLVKVEGPGE